MMGALFVGVGFLVIIGFGSFVVEAGPIRKLLDDWYDIKH